MTPTHRSTRFTKFGTQKQVYDADTMRRLRSLFTSEIARMLSDARILYWT
jgi:spore photoproduct lyase